MLCKGKEIFLSGKEKRHFISIFKINSRRLKPARRSDGFEIRRQKNDLTSLGSADLQSAASKIANSLSNKSSAFISIAQSSVLILQSNHPLDDHSSGHPNACLFLRNAPSPAPANAP